MLTTADDPPGGTREPGGDVRLVPERLVVRGGAGGVRARLEALVAAAARADRAADHLARAAHAARRAHAAAVGATAGGIGEVGPAGMPGVPVGAPGMARVVAPLAGLAWGARGLGAAGRHAADLAAGLRGAAGVYAAADLEAAAALRGVVVRGHLLGEAGPLANLLLGLALLDGTARAAGALALLRLLRATPTPAGALIALGSSPAVQRRDDVSGAVARLVGGPGGPFPDGWGLPHAADVERLVPGIAAWALASAPGAQPLVADPVRVLAGAVALLGAAVGGLLGRDRRRVLVAPLVGRTSWGAAAQPPAPTGVADVVRQAAVLGDEPVATIGVQRLDHADGSRSWVVAVPGTRTSDLVGGADPMDNATNVALMARLPDPMTEAVEVAMLRAGVGADEPVVLAGFSQGGMVAARVAERLDGTYTVAAVVTAGSPVGSMPLPADVPALHLEHAQDYVPALDGRPNPDRPSRTTVVRTLPSSGGPGHGLGLAGVGDAHDPWAYVRTARLVDADDGRSLRAFTDALGAALGDGTAQASTQRYVVARAPDG